MNYNKTIPAIREISFKDYLLEGAALFGAAKEQWRWQCPVCGRIISMQEYIDKGADDGAFGFSCIGRYETLPQRAFGNDEIKKGAGCDYTSGGLFCISPVHVVYQDGHVRETFEWGTD